MAGVIGLVGGDEFRPGCEEVDIALLSRTGVRHPKVLIVPTAAAAEDPSRAASNGLRYFSHLGAGAEALMVLGPADANDEHLISAVDDADLIYLTGGDPLHLLQTLDGSRYLQKLRSAHKRGAVVVGSSAGAMVLGSWMRFRGWRRALGFVQGTAILCHHELSQPAKLANELMGSAPAGVLVLGIDSKTGCVLGAEDWEVLGPEGVTSYFKGRWERYTRGERIRDERFAGQAEPAAPEME